MIHLFQHLSARRYIPGIKGCFIFFALLLSTGAAKAQTTNYYPISYNGANTPFSFTIQDGTVATNIPVPLNNGAALYAATGINMNISNVDNGANDYQNIPHYPEGSASFNFTVDGPSGNSTNLMFSVGPLWGNSVSLSFDVTVDGTASLGVIPAGNYNISYTTALNIYGVNGTVPTSFWGSAYIDYITEQMQFQSHDLMDPTSRSLSGMKYSVITDQVTNGVVTSPGPIDFNLGTVNSKGVFNGVYRGLPAEIKAIPTTTTVTGAITPINQDSAGFGVDNWHLVGVEGKLYNVVMEKGTMNVFDLGSATISAPTGTITSIPTNSFINAGVSNSYPQSVTVLTIDSTPIGATNWNPIYSVNSTNGSDRSVTPVNMNMIQSQGLKLVDVVANGFQYQVSLFIGIPYDSVTNAIPGVTLVPASTVQGQALNPIPSTKDLGWPGITWFQFSTPGAFTVGMPPVQIGVPSSGTNTPGGTIITQ